MELCLRVMVEYVVRQTHWEDGIALPDESCDKDIHMEWYQPRIHSPDAYSMGPPVDSVQLPYKWLTSMVYDRYDEQVFMGFINQHAVITQLTVINGFILIYIYNI